jgi:hypothetical protein
MGIRVQNMPASSVAPPPAALKISAAMQASAEMQNVKGRALQSLHGQKPNLKVSKIWLCNPMVAPVQVQRNLSRHNWFLAP